MLNNQKGITLVALVVTVVILIILATISISVVIQGGLISKTESAANLYQAMDEKFNEQMKDLEDYVNPYLLNAQAAASN